MILYKSEFEQYGGDLENSFVLNSSLEVSKICLPLYRNLQIPSFSYSRLFNSGERLYLNDNPEWIREYDSKLYQFGDYNLYPNFYRTGYHLWSEFGPKKIKTLSKEKFDISEGITIILKADEYSEIFIFCCDRRIKNPTSHLINLLPFLQRFSIYFKESAKHLIREASNKDKKILRCRQFNSNVDGSNTTNKAPDCSEFIKNTKLQKLYLLVDGQEVHLTKKELQCARMLLKGNTSKQISTLLGVSPRTAESHINNMKIKFNCVSKNQLFDKLVKHDIRSYLFL